MVEPRQMLVVDDEVDILDFVERVFRREYRVRRAGSVDEALEIIEREAIDVVITDARMPRRHGHDLLERVRARRPDTVRIMLSGYSGARAGAAADLDAELIKPVDGETLRNAVASALERRARRS